MKRLVLLALTTLTLGAAPPRPLSCTPGPYIIFFDQNQAFIKVEPRKTLDEAIENAGDCGDATVMVTGHTDTSERPALARTRAKVVRDYLAGHGIPRSAIGTESFGSRYPRVKTAQGIPERQNRRVEITYGPSA